MDYGTVDIEIAGQLGCDLHSKFIVYKYIKTSLKDVFESDRRLSNIDILSIGAQLIKCVENLHSVNYLHLDIKLDNIFVDDENKVSLIDFGQAQRYMENGSHRPNLQLMEDGNPHFGSKNAFEPCTLSRRDDVIQVVYNLMVLKNGLEPLINFTDNST